MFLVTGAQGGGSYSGLADYAMESDMGANFGLVVGATVGMFAVWLAANIFLVAVEGIDGVVPLSSRPNWRARVNTVMLLLPALAGVGAALLRS